MTEVKTQKQTHRHRKQTCGCQRGSGGYGKDWESGISRCKLEYRRWIKNKFLLYSTENYIQYPGINHNGTEYEKDYIYITLYSAEMKSNIVNQLSFNKISLKSYAFTILLTVQ